MPLLLSLLSKLLTSLLIGVATISTLALVLSQTVLNSHYLENQLSVTGSYDRVSSALVDELAQQSSEISDPLFKNKLKAILTPAAIEQKLSLALKQLQAYYEGTGQPPVIDVSDLVGQARAAGVPVGEKSGLDEPIVLNPGSQVQGAGKQYA